MFRIAAMCAGLCLAVPVGFAAEEKPATAGTPQGLAVGQNAKLLQITRDTNAGAGNGGEFYRVCNPKRAHKMCSTVDMDPGNSAQNNQSPECEIVNCNFDPRQGF